MKIKVSYGALTCTVQKNGNMGLYEEDGQRIVIPYYTWVDVKPFYSSKSKEIKSIKIKNYENSLLNPECMWYLGVGYFRSNYQALTDWEHILHLRPDAINEYHDIAIFSSNNDELKEYNQYAYSRPLINNNEQTCIFNTVQEPNQSIYGRQSIPPNEELVLIVFAYSSEQNWNAIIDSNNVEVGFSGNFEIEVEYTDYGDITTSAEITEIFSTSSANQIQFSYKFTKCESDALYYYYTSGSEVIPKEINYEPQNQQTEKTWCKITSTPTTNTDNALIGSQTLTNLDSTKQYRVVVAGRIDDPDASEEGLLIKIGNYSEDNYSEYCCIASEIATLASHPLVSVGTKITKAQMDTLRAYKNNTPPAVTQYNKITATTGNSYKTDSVSEGTSITAYWYNHS